MLCLSKKTEYALVALAYLSQQRGQVATAREIALENNLPLPLLMNILKNMRAHGLLASMRGIKGGYKITAELDRVSLFELVAMTDCSGHSSDEDCGCMESVSIVSEPHNSVLKPNKSKSHVSESHVEGLRSGGPSAVMSGKIGSATLLDGFRPVTLLRTRLESFLKSIRLADLVRPRLLLDTGLVELTLHESFTHRSSHGYYVD